MTERTGGCACGGVRYRVTGTLRPPVACHCETWRRTSGHYWAATSCPAEALALEAAETLAWWSATPGHRRGFCTRCGASLFWQREGAARISIGAGTLDGASGLGLAGHIFTAEKGDYYAIADGLPQSAGRDDGLTDGSGSGG